ncbi:MAG: hypothetical protein IH849_02345 [Acidobacteria bacterium]|nr:hypothetical protein [Acidobacteriota bacterium]
MLALLFAGASVATGGAVASLAAWRPVLLPISAVMLGLSYYTAFVRRMGGRRARVTTVVVTPVVIALWLLPYLRVWI